MAIDFMDLTLAELRQIEDTAGVPLGQLMTQLTSGEYTTATLEGLALVIGRRDDDGFNADDAGEVSFRDALAMLGGGDDDSGN